MLRTLDIYHKSKVNAPYYDITTEFSMFVHKYIVIVSIGGIQWILWFSIGYTAATRRGIFSIDRARGKLHQLGSPNLHIFMGFSWTEISLILKNKMAPWAFL